MNVLEYSGAAAATAVIMSHEMRSKKIIFVEGIHDGRLLNSIFPDAFLSIAARGITGVIDALNLIAQHNSKQDVAIDVIGFVDKDYLDLRDDDNVLKRDDVITTMYRDIEIDLLHTQAIRRFLEEKASISKWSSEKKVVKGVLETLKRLSFLRAYNAVKEKNWDFKKIDLCKYVNTSGVLKNKKLESAFRQKNHINNDEWLVIEEWMSSIDLCLKSITRGHDATCVIGQMLKRSLGNRKQEEASGEVVEENLRLAVERKFVETLAWFQGISDWAQTNGI